MVKHSKSVKKLDPVQRGPNISKKIKILNYKIIIRLTLIYGGKTWGLTSKIRSRILPLEMRTLRMIKTVTPRDHKRNPGIQGAQKVESIFEFIQWSQSCW